MARKAVREQRGNGNVDDKNIRCGEVGGGVGQDYSGNVGGAILGFYGAIKICIRGGYDPVGVMDLVLEHVRKEQEK